MDRYHAKKYLSDLGKALYGPTAPRAAQWAERRKEELDTGKFLALLNAIRRQVPRSDLARRCLHYFKTNRERMRYPEFHAQGLCTSSGVVEAGCKVAIGTRLKRAGMHWTKQGSNAIIALRCSKLSGRFQDFWERRSRTQGRMTHHFLGVRPFVLRMWKERLRRIYGSSLRTISPMPPSTFR